MRKAIVLLTILTALVAISNLAYFWLMPQISESPEATSNAQTQAPAFTPPTLEMMGQGIRPPTPPELEEEARHQDLQVAMAKDWLDSPDTAQRRVGAEQLSAFQTPESEQALMLALQSDPSAEVRRTAAQSLSAFKQPSDASTSALLAALADADEKVQMAAFNGLIAFAYHAEEGSPSLQAMLAALPKSAASKKTKPLTRQAIQSFLRDRRPPGH